MKFKVPGKDITVEIGPDGCSVSQPGEEESGESSQFSSTRAVVEKLTGNNLLSKIKELGDIPKPDVLKACGYVVYENGEERLLNTEFYSELLSAKGAAQELLNAGVGANEVENKSLDDDVNSNEHLQSGATDISEYDSTLDDDVIVFSTACAPILRRAAATLIGVEKFSTSDQEFLYQKYDSWTRAYLRLRETTHGCSAINIAKYSAICYFAICGPAQVSIEERLRYFNEFWNRLEFSALGNDDPQELSDAANDRLLAKTTNYNRRVSFSAASVLRTMFFDEWKGTKWLEDPEAKDAFEKDFVYVAEQLMFLQENNVAVLHTAFTCSLASSVSMSIQADEFPERDILLWAIKQLEYIQSTFDGQKAEGHWVDLGHDF